MCRVTPPSCPWQTHDPTFARTNMYDAPAETHKKNKKITSQSVSLISTLKQNEAPWNNESAGRLGDVEMLTGMKL